MLLRETESIRLAVITFFLLGWLQRMYPHRQGIEIKFLPIQRILVIGCSQPIERFCPAGQAISTLSPGFTNGRLLELINCSM